MGRRLTRAEQEEAALTDPLFADLLRKERVHKARKRRKQRGPDLTSVERAAVWAMTDGRCFYCGRATNPFASFCVDHVQPLIRGGTSDIDNLVPCCKDCNRCKGTLLLDEWQTARRARHRELESFRLQAGHGSLGSEPWPLWFQTEEFSDSGFDHQRQKVLQGWAMGYRPWQF